MKNVYSNFFGLLFTLMPFIGFSAVLNVPSSYITIQNGIDASVNGDTVLVDPGTYFENLNLGGKNIVLCSWFLTTGNSSHITNTIIDGNSAGRVITINQGENSSCEIVGFTIQNGNSAAELDDQYGGGIYIYFSSPVVRNCVIQNSYSPVCGGGIAINGLGFDPKVMNCTIRNNSSDGYGGGVFMGDCGADAELINCIISGNINYSYDGWNGGGGGVNLYHTGKLTNCLIINNSAPNSFAGGGGIQCDWGDYYGSQGIFVTGCTIAGNISMGGGGVSDVTGLTGGEFRNCIIWGNTDVYSYISNWSGNSYAYTCSDPLPAGTGNSNADPMYVNSSMNNFRLSTGSPCIDAGANFYNSYPVDLDGNPRIQNSTIDMGAYEKLSGLPVTVQVGSGPDVSDVLPVYSYYGYNYSQQIYLGSEIASGGGSPGTVTKIRFYYAGGGEPFLNWNNWNVYLGNTTKSEFIDISDWVPLSSLTQVFSGVVPDPVIGSWVELTLSTPFIYSGNNIVIAVDENSDGWVYPPALWGTFDAGTPRGLIYFDYTNNPDPAFPPVASVYMSYSINQVQFDITAGFGSLEGYVTEQPGCTTPVEGAIVSTGSDSTSTDASGYYRLILPAGTYLDITAHNGDVSQTISPVYITAGNTTTQDFCLPPYLAPPVSLQATVSGPVLNDVHLTWLDPGSVADQWIHWDNGISGASLGYGNYSITFSIASRWPVSDIAPYDGTYLKKIRFMVQEPTASYTIKVWKGTDASTLLLSQPVPDPDISMWTEVALSTPVLIDGTDEFWFGLEITQTQGFPAGMDQGPAVAGKGDMFNAPGWGWISVKNSWNYDWNWMLQGFVSESPILGPVATTPLVQNTTETPTVEFSGEAVATLKPMVLLSENTSTQSTFFAGPALPVSGRSFATPQSPSAPASGIFTGYNVYRDGLQIASNIPDLFYDDLALPVGIYDYEVSAQYDIGESALIGPVQVGIYSCFPPSGIIVPVATLGTTTADVSWTPSSITPVPDWDLEYGSAGFQPGFGYGTTIQVTGTPQATLTGLYPGTEYDVFIRTNCSASDHSTWVKKTFRTHYFECPVTSIPESEPCGGNTNYGCAQLPHSFESISCGDTVCGTAWLVNSQRDADWYEFTLTETTDVTFSVYSEFTNSVTLSNGSCPVTGNITSWGSYRGYLYPYTYQLNAGTYYLMVTPQWGEEVVCDSLDRYWLSLKCSTCLTPAGLTAFNITVNSADLQWNSNATSWNIEWGPGGFSQGWGTVVNANTNPYTLNGLNEGYTYSYYVQSICNGSEYSSWAGPYTFSIPCSGTLSLPYFEDFSTQTLFVTPQCWQVMGSGSSANWVVDPSNLAGGTYPELYFRNYPNYSGGTTSLLSPVINTTGQTELNLSFLHNLYPYNMNPECGISTTSDGGNTWNSVWTFSPYGTSGYESITISTPDVGSATFQFAFMIIGNSWDLGTWAIDDISLSATGGGKSLTVKLFLEGLYNGAGGLNQSYDEFGPHFAPGVADQVTLELRNEFSYPTLEFSTGPVDLGTDGMVNTTVPNSLTGNYYVTVRHRNSIETTTAFPVDFSGSTVSYDFTISQSQAYADNQKDNGDGSAAIYGGDVNQDGIVDGGDMNPVDNLATAITFGYVPEDVNGDGIVDGGDMNIVDNNSTAIIMALVP